MQKDHVITFRIDDDQLKAIDDIVMRHHYYKRSSVMAQALRIMVELEKRGLAGQALSFHPKWDEIDTLDFKMHRRVR